MYPQCNTIKKKGVNGHIIGIRIQLSNRVLAYHVKGPGFNYQHPFKPTHKIQVMVIKVIIMIMWLIQLS
jgi:hypothetical protein